MTRWTRARQGAVVVPVVLVVAVVVAVWTLRDPDDVSGPDASSARSASPNGSVTASASESGAASGTTPVDPDAWCVLFRDFAEANSTYVAAPDEATADALVQAGTALLDAGRPLGLDEAGFASLGELVGGALAGAGGPSSAPSGPVDQAAFDTYLATACPA